MFYRILLLPAILAISGSLVYKIHALDALGVSTSLLIGIAFYLYLIVHFPLQKNNTASPQADISSKADPFLLAASLLVSALALAYLFGKSTEQSIISPWEMTGSAIFYIMATGLAIAFLSSYLESRFFLAITALQLLCSLSVAIIIYKLGYGFDPFIHIATEELIDEKGFVDPKPLYYLGQYSLVIIFHKLTAIPIPLIDRLLLPLSAAIILPKALYSLSKYFIQEDKIRKIATISIIFLPLSFFINTTPQGLAYLSLILALLSSFQKDDKASDIFTVIFALAAMSFHLIAGIPALIYALANLGLCKKLANDIPKTFRVIIFSAFALPIPALFLLLDIKHDAIPQIAALDWSYIGNFLIGMSPKFPNSQGLLLNSAYFFIQNAPLFLLGIGAFSLWQGKDISKDFPWLRIAILGTIAALIITALLPFDFLISYEKGNYVSRLAHIAAIFAIPYFMRMAVIFWRRALSLGVPVVTILTIAAISIISISIYASYPRLDSYHNSHGVSTGKADIEAARWIAADSGNKDYIVLANQQVSAAALKEYGFSKYYKGDIFYYPVPTSMPLYGYYLTMVNEKPGKTTATEAMDYAGADVAYFVLNKYWWAEEKIREEAKMEADAYHSISGGEITIFKYQR